MLDPGMIGTVIIGLNAERRDAEPRTEIEIERGVTETNKVGNGSRRLADGLARGLRLVVDKLEPARGRPTGVSPRVESDVASSAD